ncbi:Ataxin-3 [Lunasporangiospora selenospora]|uniref:Ataxin-3 homolog n=1 Tax=Lunasporangiospora selenospora TaxID=979761 RepID=A0A9P6FSV3_9FUNG|nr:Ataxin-3 [Lunasporangiospora selenospora]
MDLVPFIFHEQQEGNLCAQHCLNALLQGPYFTAIDLAELARQLDQQEQIALGDTSGRPTKSQNMDDSGFFSIQVLSHALTIWNTQITPWGSEEVRDAKAAPEREKAFICNLDQHWYTLRRFGPSTERWYDLNSLHPTPRHMSSTFLGMTLSQLEAEGYSIFVVRPLSATSSTTTVVETSPTEPIRESPALPSASTSTVPVAGASPASSFLSERQEMERIRRQRLEERQRATEDPPQSSSTSVATTEVQESKTEGVLVTTPTFLPRCESDAMAEKLPMTNVSQQQGASGKDATSTFGGAGYRLGSSEPLTAAESDYLDDAALAAQISSGDFGGGEWEGDADTEEAMIQEAIAMSLRQG